jgi:hypothetical protein
MAEEKVVKLRSADGPPEIEISIDQAQWGSYKLFLWTPDGSTSQQFGTGLNVDQIPDVFVISQPAVKDLHGWLLTWEVAVAAFSSGAGQRYAVTVTVKQKGQIVPGGRIVNSDSLQGAVFVFDFVRLQVS